MNEREELRQEKRKKKYKDVPGGRKYIVKGFAFDVPSWKEQLTATYTMRTQKECVSKYTQISHSLWKWHRNTNYCYLLSWK